MLQAGSALTGYAIEASDGRIGTVGDFLFDDVTWTMRWLVLDLGTWLPGRKVLLHPGAIVGADHEGRQLVVALSKAEIRGSPGILEDPPVSRQMEHRLDGEHGDDAPPVVAAPAEEDGDPRLRSLAAVVGYEIHAGDGAVGHLEDMLVDPESWALRYLVIDTGIWLPSRHALVSSAAVQGISWAGRQIRIDVSRELIETSPAWDAADVDESYEQLLRAHYGWSEYPVDAGQDLGFARVSGLAG